MRMYCNHAGLAGRDVRSVTSAWGQPLTERQRRNRARGSSNQDEVDHERPREGDVGEGGS